MTYNEAIEFIEEFLEIAEPLWKNPRFPFLEPRMEQALKVLKSQPAFKGGRTDH